VPKNPNQSGVRSSSRDRTSGVHGNYKVDANGRRYVVNPSSDHNSGHHRRNQPQQPNQVQPSQQYHSHRPADGVTVPKDGLRSQVGDRPPTGPVGGSRVVRQPYGESPQQKPPIRMTAEEYAQVKAARQQNGGGSNFQSRVYDRNSEPHVRSNSGSRVMGSQSMAGNRANIYSRISEPPQSSQGDLYSGRRQEIRKTDPAQAQPKYNMRQTEPNRPTNPLFGQGGNSQVQRQDTNPEKSTRVTAPPQIQKNVTTAGSPLYRNSGDKK